MLPASSAILSSFIAAADGAPDQLSTIAILTRLPPLQFVPSEHHGRLALMVRLDLDQAESHESWVTHLLAAMRHRRARRPVSFLGEESAARIHEAYRDGTYGRPAAIKRRHDPTNLCWVNHNIVPHRWAVR